MTAETKPDLTLPNWTNRQVVVGTLVVLAVALGFWLLVHEEVVVFSLFAAIVISTAIAPAVDWLYQRGLPRAAGVVLIYLGLLAALVGFLLLIVPLLAEQGATVVQNSGGLYQSLLNTLRLSPSSLIRRLAWQLPAGVTVAPPPAGDAQAQGAAFDAVARALGYLGVVSHGAFAAIAVLLLAFYWTLERERVLRFLLLFVPMGRRDGVRDLFVAAESKVGAYIRGVFILSLIVAVLAFAAYLLIGLPYALLLGLAAGVFEVVPVLGPTISLAAAVLIALSVDPSKAIWAAIAFGTIQFLENSVIAPRVMGKTVGVSPVVTLLALIAFGGLFGPAGALLAIPLAAVVQILLDRYVLSTPPVEETPPEGRDEWSVLRYGAQDLVRDVRKQLRDKSTALDDQSDAVEDAIEALAADLDSLLAQRAPEAEASTEGGA